MKQRLFLIVILFLCICTFLFAKDVYVRAGNDGEGEVDDPYGSIADAMSMGIYAGDVIHVAEGVYYGKGGSGLWVIDTNNLTLVGGYNKEFSERNPWKYPSILVRGMGTGALKEAQRRGHDMAWGMDYTMTRASYNPGSMIQGDKDHSNTIIDGFVVDGYSRLTYRKNGDLKTDVGPIGVPLISLKKPGCKIRNCLVMNSGGPGIRLGAYGEKGDEDTWAEVFNCVVVNTLMQALDFRIGNLDPDRAPDGGYALVKNNTLAFVWSWLGEGYGILIGRQTNLQIENNIIAFASDYGLNNGFGNNKAKLVNNCFFNNWGGVYRYFAKKDKVTVVEDNPKKFKGTGAKKKYYLNSKSKGNYTADPKLKPDPDFFDKFTNQIKSSGSGKVVWDEVNQWRSSVGLPLLGSTGKGKMNYAPVYEHKHTLLFSSTVKAGASEDVNGLEEYESVDVEIDKDYADMEYKDIKFNAGKDVTVSLKIGPSEAAGFYADGITGDEYVTYRTADRQTFIYIQKGSEALEVIEECKADGIPALVDGTVVDIYANVKMKNRYAIVVDSAVWDE